MLADFQPSVNVPADPRLASRDHQLNRWRATGARIAQLARVVHKGTWLAADGCVIHCTQFSELCFLIAASRTFYCRIRQFARQMGGGEDDRVPCLQEIMLKIAVEVGLVVGDPRRQLRRKLSNKRSNQWHHLLKWHQLFSYDAYYYRDSQANKVLSRLVFKDSTTSFFAGMKSGLTVCVKSCYRYFRHNVVYCSDPICAHFLAPLALFAPA